MKFHLFVDDEVTIFLDLKSFTIQLKDHFDDSPLVHVSLLKAKSALLVIDGVIRTAVNRVFANGISINPWLQKHVGLFDLSTMEIIVGDGTADIQLVPHYHRLNPNLDGSESMTFATDMATSLLSEKTISETLESQKHVFSSLLDLVNDKSDQGQPQMD